jgi:alkylated DNA repair dioxygenase AlkB
VLSKKFADGDLIYYPDFLNPEHADAYFDLLIKEVDWEEEEIRIFGKTHKVPRLVAWHGDAGISYRYSGTEHKAKGWTETLLTLRDTIAAVSQSQYNSVLLNYYRDGQDSMGWHSDDEAELGSEPVIASLSLGTIRRFDLRKKLDHQQKIQLPLAHGSLLIMKGSLQSNWQHQVPKQRKIPEGRLNLTFRRIYG